MRVKEAFKGLTPEKVAMFGALAFLAESLRYHVLSPFVNRVVMYREVDERSTSVHWDQFVRTILLVALGAIFAWGSVKVYDRYVTRG